MNDAVVAQLVFGVSLAVITSVVAVQIANINITYTVSVRFSMPMVNIVKSRQGSPNVAQINTCLSKLSQIIMLAERSMIACPYDCPRSATAQCVQFKSVRRCSNYRSTLRNL